MSQSDPTYTAGKGDVILVTGSAGFIGSKVVEYLLSLGFGNVRCLVRSPRSKIKMRSLLAGLPNGTGAEVIQGDLLSREDCRVAARDARVIFHLAAGRGEKSYPDAFLNSVVTTRNLIEASLSDGSLRRFVNVSSFAVYTNRDKARRGELDETCAVETHPELRGDAYTFAKVKQDELVTKYGHDANLPYVIVRPGHVYGPGNEAISARVGIDTFGRFLHLGGSNWIPLTYIDNCAEAIVLAGLKALEKGESFNIVDDDLPTSRRFLSLYKRNALNFPSSYIPHWMSYTFCWLWESFSTWSEGQLPPVFNRRRWHSFWKKTRYSNQKLKTRLGWAPRVSTHEGLRRYFEACRNREANA